MKDSSKTRITPVLPVVKGLERKPVRCGIERLEKTPILRKAAFGRIA
jgi:hypothetical protein